MGLLQAKVIQTELGITEAMTEELRNAMREMMQQGERPQGFGNFRDMSEEERQPRWRRCEPRCRNA